MTHKLKNYTSSQATDLEVFLALSFRPPCNELIICLRNLDTFAPEVVHQTRVAIRTLQSYLEAFDTILKQKHVHEFHIWLRKLHKSLNQIRNLDVYRELISTDKVVLVNREFVIAEMSRLRALEVSKITPILTPELVTGYVHTIEIFISTLPIRKKVSSMKSSAQHELLVTEIEKIWTSFKMSYKKSRVKASPRSRHQLRISAKNIRYIYELCHLMEMSEHPERLRKVVELQDKLGLQNDLYNFHKWLRIIASSELPAIGHLSKLQLGRS